MSRPDDGFWLPWELRRDLLGAVDVLRFVARKLGPRESIEGDVAAWDSDGVSNLAARLEAAAPTETGVQAPRPAPLDGLIAFNRTFRRETEPSNPWESWAVREIHWNDGGEKRLRCRWVGAFLEIDHYGIQRRIPCCGIQETRNLDTSTAKPERADPSMLNDGDRIRIDGAERTVMDNTPPIANRQGLVVMDDRSWYAWSNDAWKTAEILERTKTRQS